MMARRVSLAGVLGCLGLLASGVLAQGGGQEPAQQKADTFDAQVARMWAGDTEGCGDAVRVMHKRPRPEGAMVLLRVLGGLPSKELALAMQVIARFPEVEGTVPALAQHLGHEDRDVRRKARHGLGSARSVALLAQLLDEVEARREPLVERLWTIAEVRNGIAKDLERPKDRWRHWDQLAAWEEARDREWPVVGGLLAHEDGDVRVAAIEFVAKLPTPDVLDALAELARDDPESKVRSAAATALTGRGDLRAFEQKFRGAVEDWDRYGLACVSLGWRYGGVLVPWLLREYRLAAGDDYRRKALRDVLRGAVRVSRRQKTHAALTEALGSADPAVRELAAANLKGWKPRAEDDSEEWRNILFALAATAIALLGVLTYVCGFRLLRLRRVLSNLPIQTARAIALGRVAVRGVARPVGRAVKHPVTGEPCAWFPPVEGQSAAAQFSVHDDTGSVLIDADHAVLLSEDGVISDGEMVHVVGTASSDSKTTVIGLRDEPARSLFNRMVDAALRLMFGWRRRSGAARLLLADARTFFCIWDDARERPLDCVRETAVLFAGMVFAGGWVLVALLVFLGGVEA